jgi:SAM-dependent methyltransferase
MTLEASMRRPGCERETSRVLVVLASYGSTNDKYLSQLIEEYQSMSFDIQVVVLSNIPKRLNKGVEIIVGLPNKDPWSLPFNHKRIFADRLSDYDLFIYSEDDVLITEQNVRAFLSITPTLKKDEIAGFIRVEVGPTGDLNYPEMHGNFHWEPSTVRRRNNYTLAHFSNEHAACYMLTQDQLKQAIKSGGFLIAPHEWKYDLACSAATDPYTKCGFLKLIPISHLDTFTVKHLSGRYFSSLGVKALEMRHQIDALLQSANGGECPSAPLFSAETKLRRGRYSKSYYEPTNEAVLAAIPETARSVLSVGCAWGATERQLRHRGLHVTIVPMDPIISCSAKNFGIESVIGDFEAARKQLEAKRFDCVLFLNVLQFLADPINVISLFSSLLATDGRIIIQMDNVLQYRRIISSIRSVRRVSDLAKFDLTGIHLVSARTVRNWCHRSGLVVETTIQVLPEKANRLRHSGVSLLGWLLAREWIIVARKA